MKIKPIRWGIHTDHETGESYLIAASLFGKAMPLSPNTVWRESTIPQGLKTTVCQIIVPNVKELKKPKPYTRAQREVLKKMRPLLPVPYLGDPPVVLLDTDGHKDPIHSLLMVYRNTPLWLFRQQRTTAITNNLGPLLVELEGDEGHQLLADILESPRTQPVVLMVNRKFMRENGVIVPKGIDWMEVTVPQLLDSGVCNVPTMWDLMKHYAKRVYEAVQFGEPDELSQLLPAINERPWEGL